MIAMAKRKVIDGVFGMKLRHFRRAAGLTQAELGEKTGVQGSVIARLETGGREPGWATVLKLAAAVGKTPNDFMEVAPSPPAEPGE